MSSRVLRKLQGDQDLGRVLGVDGNSDVETDVTGSSERKKSLNVNRYDLLNQQSLSESEVKEDDDHETESKDTKDGIGDRDSSRRKKKKKKKKSAKSLSCRRSSEDIECDEVERSVREVNKILGETPSSNNYSSTDGKPASSKKFSGILSVEHRNLNPNIEMKRIFGSKVIQTEQSKRRGRGRGTLKSTWLVTPKENWPQIGKSGLSMSLVETKNGIQYFKYEHNFSYQQIQMKFLEAVESLNPDNIVAIINMHPYHVDALIQLSDLSRMSEDLQMAVDLIARALYCLECAFHPLFNIAQGNCQLDYRRQENRALFIALFKHMTFVGQRACYRTSLEFCKLLLSLDPVGDPVAAVLIVDFYALRCHEYEWFIRLFEEWENQGRNLLQLPNFAFSVAVAHFYLATHEAESKSNTDGSKASPKWDILVADQFLQNALIMFPGVLLPLLDKCSIQPEERVTNFPFFGVKAQMSQPPALLQLIQLYIARNYHIWKEPALLPWLEKNVNKVIDRVISGDPLVKESEIKRMKRYVVSPNNILRHIILSDLKDVSATINGDIQGPLLSFDPLPPHDSINLYTRPQRTRAHENSNAFSMFFRSILPNFNINEPVRENAHQDEGPDAAEGGGNAENSLTSSVDLHRSVTSLLDAMRDLLSNIHFPDVPHDGDVDDDDNDDSEEDNNPYHLP
ncbi:ribosome quality control complex subunit TCF25 [Hetaerina americana]|uniref:ribosome quality control complex subunit TCF25 n=1 Tax=Hetaerina americana TaxID=62018 RepID=UPI003A7F4A93